MTASHVFVPQDYFSNQLNQDLGPTALPWMPCEYIRPFAVLLIDKTRFSTAEVVATVSGTEKE
ncbi:MAG: hypothetical protein GY854_21985 [Deltaproteobacteria bacterium]|nr:hypothetical protein [Deltaproteobacteria bacterium]